MYYYYIHVYSLGGLATACPMNCFTRCQAGGAVASHGALHVKHIGATIPAHKSPCTMAILQTLCMLAWL